VSFSTPTSDDVGQVARSARVFRPEDAAAARTLVDATLGATPYVDRIVELLDVAARGIDPEVRALVIDRGATIVGLVIFGLVAGTNGAAKLHALVLDRGMDAHDIGGRLIDAAATAAAASGARLLVAEMPDDAALGVVSQVLLRNGFEEEARVPHFFRDGVALTFLRRELA
jgi:hypothetical protein